MLRVLVPVDGSSNSLRAVDHLIEKRHWYADGLEIHLLNVQHSVQRDVGQFVGSGAVREFQHEEGLKALAPARARLDAAGVPYAFHIGVGHPPETIALYAEQKKADLIVLGTRARGGVAGLLLGSVATPLVRHTSVPILLLK
jgi:nucleotide-binding universal stress UspA family protein